MKARIGSFTTVTLLVLSLGMLVMLNNSRAQQGRYQSIGPGECGIGQATCHATQNEWWSNDAHFGSYEKIFYTEDKYKQMADRYAQRNPGSTVNSGNYLHGDQPCMKCHASVVSANISEDVEDGVSCESCHGPGSGYLKSHQKENGGGYEKGVADGLYALKDIDVLAKTCVGCHFVADPRLVNDFVKHPDGGDFVYPAKMKTVAAHWKNRKWTAADGKASNPKFDAAKQAKRAAAGSIANAVVKVPKTTAPPATSAQEATSQPVASTTSQASAAPVPTQPRRVRTSRARPTNPEPVKLGPIDLPPFPAVADSSSADQIMLLIKKRLELLYKKTSKR